MAHEGHTTGWEANTMPGHLCLPSADVSTPRRGPGPIKIVATVFGLGWESNSGLFPAILNLASNAKIHANATCGENSAEIFCKLVEHVPGRPNRNSQCRVCNLNSHIPDERHPITNANDGTNGWWQSPSIQNGRKFHWVTITLDLQQVFQVAYVIVKAANSPRPGNWILERSLDGATYHPWQYYSVSDSECLTRYGITPTVGNPVYRRDDEVICTSYYSRLVPLENGEIHTSLINGRPSADDPSPKLLDFTSARYIRLRLQRIRTLNADLMTLSHRDPREVDPIVTRRYYYSIKDISVGGMCICSGHASTCPWNEDTQKMECQCEHNTCGENCQHCCPGYNQRRWRPGTINNGNTCEKCNCHGKTEDCYYDAEVDRTNRSLSVHGRFSGGGVCVNCSANTAGTNCETCRDGFYRPTGVSPNDPYPCRLCQCDPQGSLSQVCIKDEKHADPERDLSPGQCLCRPGFAGERCERCAFAYRGYPDCKPCLCSMAGGTNDDPCSEPCVCKERVEGEHCDRCRAGFYDLRPRNPRGCSACFCFGLSSSCRSLPWGVTQVVDMRGWRVTDRQGLRKVKTFVEVDQVAVRNADVRRTLPALYYWLAPTSYLGNKLTAYAGHLRYSVSYDIPVDSTDSEMISDVDVIIEGNGQALSSGSLGLMLQPFEEQTLSLRLLPENFFDFRSNAPVSRDALMTALANVTRLQIRASYSSVKQAVYRLSAVSLDVASPDAAVGSPAALDVEQCHCPHGYAGTSCESCMRGHRRVDGTLHGGRCEPCRCHGHADDCDDLSGDCMLPLSGCRHNTMGPHCELCRPGFYGNATRGTADDCLPCTCPLSIASNNFSPTCHQDPRGVLTCDQCLPGYIGLRCERCADDFFGEPSSPGGSCRRCECNGNEEAWGGGRVCDARTGQCLRCRERTAGFHCERCADGFYGDATGTGGCQPCQCHPEGATAPQCDRINGQCPCRPSVVGRTCEQCAIGFYGLSSGAGCSPCPCHPVGTAGVACSADGRCHCWPGVEGRSCDRCTSGHYGFKEGGCTPCNCSHTNHHCDQETGRCLCPPNTEGTRCHRCIDDHWGVNPHAGCRACNCSAAHSRGARCDEASGQCSCLDGYGGRTCGECAQGRWGYPACRPCECHPEGTRANTCPAPPTGSLCGCDERTGQCACKENVGGTRCDACLPGTFGLNREDPRGCTACFCFGVSSVCRELQGFVRMQVFMVEGQRSMPVVNQVGQRETMSGVRYQHPEMILHAGEVLKTLHHEPFYWKLPSQFTGPKLTAYGGKLRYTVYFEAEDGSGRSDREPQVLLRGGRNKELLIYRDMAPPRPGQRTQHQMDMTEHEWRYFNSVLDQPVSRADFMSILGGIGNIFIKASYGSRMTESRISEVSLEVAARGNGSSHLQAACQVEQCECPPGYSGLSCQECAPGFFRDVSARHVPGQPRLVLGPCIPCHCNNHSASCDPESGRCQGCRHNTTGHHCDHCAPGYYGRVKGRPDDCTACACPKSNPNNFSPTCTQVGVDDFRCDACRTGYTGQYCERCSPGYYGNPSLPGEPCRPCGCHGDGSLGGECHHATGQCACLPGVMGRACDQCQPRHVLVNKNCLSCNDDCTGLLLNDLDVLAVSVMSVNLTGLIPAPYSRLEEFANMTRTLGDQLKSQKPPSQMTDAATRGVADVIGEIDAFDSRATRVLEEARATEQQLRETQERAGALLASVRSALNAALELVGNVSRLRELAVGGEDGGGTVPRAFADMEHLVAQIRAVSLARQRDVANKELGKSRELLDKVKQAFEQPRQANEGLAQDVSDLLWEVFNRLSDLQRILNEAKEATTMADELNQSNNKSLVELKDKSSTLERNLNSTKEMISQGEKILGNVKQTIHEIDKLLKQAELDQERLDTAAPKLRDRVDATVMALREKGLIELVFRAENHSAAMQALAAQLSRILDETKNQTFDATTALNAYGAIVQAVADAEETAQQADSVAGEALAQAAGPSGSLEQAGRASLQLSSELLRETKDLNDKATGFSDRLAAIKMQVTNGEDKTKALARQLASALASLASLPNDTSRAMEGVTEAAKGASEVASGVLEETMDLNKKIMNVSEHLDRVAENERSANAFIDDSAKNIAEASDKLRDVEERAARLSKRMEPFGALQDNLGRNISVIKELINQARKQAASIKVSVQSSTGDCVRTYRPEIPHGKLTYNSMVLHVKTSEPDNLLFYLGGSQNPDYMAVEMRRGRVSLVWDVGSGPGRVEYPDLAINDGNWYRIEATRSLRVGALSIRAFKGDRGGVSQLPSRGTSPEGNSAFDVDETTLLFIGGLTGGVKADSVKATSFKGCMGEAFLDGRSVGLWNFREMEGTCGGCEISPQAAEAEVSTQFDGEGFVPVERPIRWNSEVSIITFKFRTFSPNALLMYLATADKKDFLSIELVNGQVRVWYDLGSGPGNVTSDNKHNDGNWRSLKFSRSKQMGTLIVEDEARNVVNKKSRSQGASGGLNLSSMDLIYFGGLPDGVLPRGEVKSRTFTGCIKGVEISRSYFNLLTFKNSIGVKKGCSLEHVHMASIESPGFVELPATTASLPPSSEISFSFSSTNASGLLLHAAGEQSPRVVRKRRQSGVPYYAVYLLDGNLEVLFSTGDATRKIVKKSTGGAYSDGREHAVVVSRRQRVVRMSVDDSSSRDANLGSDGEITVARLFVGGTSAGYSPPSSVPVHTYTGCVQNIIVNGVLQDFAHSLNFDNVDIGRCRTSEPRWRATMQPTGRRAEGGSGRAVVVPELNRPQPGRGLPTPPPHAAPNKPATTTAQMPVRCAVEAAASLEANSLQFGLKKDSHAVLTFDRDTVKRRLVLQLSVRTVASDGLLLYMGSANNLAALQLIGGRPQFTFDLGKGVIKVTAAQLINDGIWHTLRVERGKRKVDLSVDTRQRATTKLPSGSSNLEVERRLYLGGAPAGSPGIKRLGNVTHSLAGCIGDFSLNGAKHSLSPATFLLNHVEGCYQNVEPGFYFQGTGYAMLAAGGYRVGTDLEISLEFRTTQLDGVLLAISSPRMDAVGIELVAGKVLFHADNGAGRFSAELSPLALTEAGSAGTGAGHLCDGHWHRLEASKLKNRLVLKVDGAATEAASPHQSNSADTNDPVYVGGFREGVKQHALTTQVPFRGCIRNLRFMKSHQIQPQIHLGEASDMMGVLPHSCPAQS
uniref:Basement membrane-specific heparan sulfate proteoglycan core protein n=1 Tax=Petromyzon marinus TaxID=7757 RepID=A0AAJ7WSU8_PETMA|nr:laminin subunit alpha-1-like isoform X2 [Petromyzon marinus]